MLSGAEAINDAVRQSHMVVTHAAVIHPDQDASVALHRIQATGGQYVQDRTTQSWSRLTLEIPAEDTIDLTTGLPTILPYGDRIRVWRGIVTPDGMAWSAQIGEFRVDSTSLSRPSATMTIEASSLMAQVVDSQFTEPRLIRNDADREGTLRTLCDEALQGWSRRAPRAPDDTNSLGAIYNRSRIDAVMDLATSLGVDVLYNNVGQLVTRPTPTPVDEPVWTIDVGDDGVAVSYGTAFSRADSYNGVVAEGRSPFGRPMRYLATLDNPDDPLRWGGPFGRVPHYYTSDVMRTVEDCRIAAEARLYDGVGRARRVSITCAAHSGLEAGDTIALTTVTGLEIRVICDQVTMPLGPGTMTIEGRVVRGWDYVGG